MKVPWALFLPSVRTQDVNSPLTAAPTTWSITFSLSTLFTVLWQSTEPLPFSEKVCWLMVV